MKTIFSTILILSIFINSSFAQQYWNEVSSGTTLKLNTISFGSDQVGYVGADDSTILKTTDGGSTWSVLQHTGITFTGSLRDVIDIDFLNANEGFLTINNSDTLTYYAGTVFKTVDGGSTWTQDFPNICSPIKTFHFDINNGFAIGASCFGGKTIDYKNNGNWTNTTYLSWNIDYLRAIAFQDTSYGIVGGDSATIHRTFDGGTTWDTINLGITNPSFNDAYIAELAFVNASTIIAATNLTNELFRISTDSGKTWTNSFTTSFMGPKVKSLTFSPKDSVISVGHAANSSNNLGTISHFNKTLNSFEEQSTRDILYDVAMTNDSIAFAVGDSGLIMTNKILLTGVQQLTAPIANLKVFPNPTANYIYIQHPTQTGKASLQVHNLLGQLLMENQVELIANKQLQLNIEDLPTGIYTLSLHLENSLHTTLIQKE
ncbi:MAG: T9SS type A sorting domain-containing protein [Aureispira sp.]|nr:T9SS type A sorting domain-containing protein [Aureispira sp.]